MKRIPLICAYVLVAAASAAAQGASYRFDNFDTSDGVRIEIPNAPKPAKTKKRLQLAARNETAARAVKAAKEVAAAPLRVESAPVGVGNSLEGFSTGDAKVDGLIVEAGRRHGVDPVLLYAIMHRESAFKKRAISHKGASGLMQLMPATARRFGVRDIFDPSQNIEGGARYMRWLLNTFDGDVRLALAGYNAGEGAVMKYGWRVPPYRETQEYVRRITERYSLMRDPQTARRAPRVTRTQVAKLKSAEPRQPELVYEREVFAVRTPDGKLMLVSQ